MIRLLLNNNFKNIPNSGVVLGAEERNYFSDHFEKQLMKWVLTEAFGTYVCNMSAYKANNSLAIFDKPNTATELPDSIKTIENSSRILRVVEKTDSYQSKDSNYRLILAVFQSPPSPFPGAKVPSDRELLLEFGLHSL